jgi:hypothetical protein
MSEDQDKTVEDLDLEESEAASVAGGMSMAGRGGDDPGNQLASLKAKGYVEDACTTEGTLWINPKTKHKIMIRGT